MPHYLIEFRFQGKAKKELKDLIWRVDKKCRIGNAKRKRPIPHITLVAPFTTNNESRLLRDFKDLCSSQKLMKFKLKGFNVFNNKSGAHVVYFDITPSTELDEFRWRMAKKLKSYCKLNSIDNQRKYYFHSTIAMKLTDKKFNQVKRYVKRMEIPQYKHLVLRVTLLKGSKILREYDFMQRRMFNRRLAKNRKIMSKSRSLMKQYFAGKYNPDERVRKQKFFMDKIRELLRI